MTGSLSVIGTATTLLSYGVLVGLEPPPRRLVLTRQHDDVVVAQPVLNAGA